MCLCKTMKENIRTDSVKLDNSRVIRAFGQEAHVLISSEQTGDAFCVLRFFAPPGNVTPPHVHHATDETFLIESGEGEINRGGEALRVRKGDVKNAGWRSGEGAIMRSPIMYDKGRYHTRCRTGKGIFRWVSLCELFGTSFSAAFGISVPTSTQPITRPSPRRPTLFLVAPVG
jgi:Cupin domain